MVLPPTNKDAGAEPPLHVVGKEKGFSDVTLPQVYLRAGDAPGILDQIESIILQSRNDIFVCSDRVVRVEYLPSGKNKRVDRPDGGIILFPVDTIHLTEIIAACVDCKNYDKRIEKYRTVNPPRWIAEMLLARKGLWTFRYLKGVIESPVVDMSGRVITKHGWDEKTGLYLATEFPKNYSAPLQKPSREQAMAAAKALEKLLSEFSFYSKADKCAALCGFISVILRRTFDTAPAICITAPAAGTGKSVLTDVMAVLETGRRASVHNLGNDPAESEKRLAAALMEGSSPIALDNQESIVNNPLLCQAITQLSIKLRPLGGSNLITVHSNCSFIINGNNLDIRGDMRRRTMLIRLDAKSETPEQRRYKRDLIAYTKRYRFSLINAVLTLPLAYEAAGSPKLNVKPRAGFDEWNHRCRLPLIWLGYPDPLEPSAVLKKTDPDLAAQRQLFAAWSEVYRQTPISAADAIAGSTPELREAMNLVTNDKVTSRRLGGWLSRHEGRVVDGLRLDRTEDTHKKIGLWRISKCE